MTSEELQSSAESLANSGIYVSGALLASETDLAGKLILNACMVGIPRAHFRELHLRYRAVPEIYVERRTFDLFCPPKPYLAKLADELGKDIEIDLFFEALGCYLELNEQQLETLNKSLTLPVDRPVDARFPGVVLMCWDRINGASRRLGEGGEHYLLYAVAFHEHSHAARAARLLKHSSARVLQAEETVAQWETYMFLSSRNEDAALEAMRKLMEHQPLCYRIRI
ncbi:hypothetical protein MYX77_10375 [Acidobacteriia bacterium AH_259_A11_L15]|nr:hypothetical protein [Acidobacteriia bacterium AH_259_A11_L15]